MQQSDAIRPDIEKYIMDRIELIHTFYVDAASTQNRALSINYAMRFYELRRLAEHMGMEIETMYTFLNRGLVKCKRCGHLYNPECPFCACRQHGNCGEHGRSDNIADCTCGD